MIRDFRLSELVEPLDAVLHGDDLSVSAITTDSRQISGGELFVALTGEYFDGHDFLGTAREQGAAATVVSTETDSKLPRLQVQNTLYALGKLGAYNRQLFAGKVLAVTGSAGKTTVKNLLAAVLEQAGVTHATQGNFNNEIGVPLTLLGISATDQYAVVEMGAARAGDIAYLCSLARPDVALLLNAMPAHLVGFGSVDGVAQAKGEIVADLGEQGCAVINADSPYADAWRERAGRAQVVTFGRLNVADVYASEVEEQDVSGSSFMLHTPQGQGLVQLNLNGLHNVDNALAAAAAAFACGVELEKIRVGLSSVKPHSGRLVPVKTASGVCVIDDSYNANPGSVCAAIDLLARVQGRRWLMLGAMAELGDESDQLHVQVGEHAANRGIDEFWAVGDIARPAVQAFGASGRCFDALDEMLAVLRHESLGAGDTVLVKGSRSAGMERAVAALTNEGEV